jgi:hypothetical protein
MTTDQDRYDQLTDELADTLAEITRLTSVLGVLKGAREDVANKLAAAATSDPDLVRWSSTTEGAKRLTGVLTALHPAFVGVAQYRRGREGGDVWLMPEVDMPWIEEIDDKVEQLADALADFGHRFGADPLPVEAHSSRIAWAKDQQLQPGWVPVYLSALEGGAWRWMLSFDPMTRVAMLLDTDGYEATMAGTLPQMLVAASRKLHGIDD